MSGAWCGIEAKVSGASQESAEGSLEQFITEHYWGYTKHRRGRSLEYRVEHVPWRVRRSTAAEFRGDADLLYGLDLGAVVCRVPDSAFIAAGSPVTVYSPTRIS